MSKVEIKPVSDSEAWGIMQKYSESLEKENKKLKEQLKLKTQNEVNASVNADCLDGCREQKKKLIEALEKIDREWFYGDEIKKLLKEIKK